MAKRQPWSPLLCGYPDSVKINALSEGAEVMYTRLIARCDDGANFDGSPVQLLCKLFARRFEAGQIDVTEAGRRRAELVAVGLAAVYEVDGVAYLHLIDCHKATRKDVKGDFRYPPYPASVNDAATPTEPPRPALGPTPSRTRDDSGPLEENRTEENRPPLPPQGAGGGFERFWGLYPRKTGKPAAQNAWDTLGVTNDLIERICSAVKARRSGEQWRREQGRYIPKPANWLRDQGWLDGAATVQSSSPHACATCGGPATATVNSVWYCPRCNPLQPLCACGEWAVKWDRKTNQRYCMTCWNAKHNINAPIDAGGATALSAVAGGSSAGSAVT